LSTAIRVHSGFEVLLERLAGADNPLWGINLYPDLAPEDMIEF
jgi:hypothetical protein